MAMIFMIWWMLQASVDSTFHNQQPYQSISYQIDDLSYKASFDPSTGKIYLYHVADSTFITLAEDSRIDTVGTLSGAFERLEKMDVTHDGDAVYFWENGIGIVHRYDIATNTMIREDTSHRHRTMFSHAPFLSKENFIYAIGGYGYWEMRNILIRYEPEFGQWEKVPSVNDDIVLRSWRGLLYKLGDSFYYFVDETENESDDHRKTFSYRFDIETGTWYREHELETVFEKFSIDGRFSNTKFIHTSSHMVDPNNQQLGFLSSTASDELLNLVDTNGQSIHQVNLTSNGIHDVRAAFYSERIKKWVVLGHEYPISERMRLRVFLYEFDESNPFITTFTPGSIIPTEALFITSGGLIVIGIIGFILFLKFRRWNVTDQENQHDSTASKPVKIIRSDDDQVSVKIDGIRITISEDPALEELWKIIADLAEADESSILVSDIDQRIYPDQTHPSQNTRNRKKLIKIINTACGFDLINEERSKIDKRYKVLTIQIDKISIKSS